MTKTIPPKTGLGHYWKLFRRAASTPTPTLNQLLKAEWRNMRNGDGSAYLGFTKDYRALGYTLEGARWMVEKAAENDETPEPPEDFEQLFPAAASIAITDDPVLVAKAVLFYGDGPAFETDFSNPDHVKRLEHLIGKSYESENPTTWTAIEQWAGLPQNDDERNRRNRWDFLKLIERKIADGTITPVYEMRDLHGKLVPLGCLIRLANFVAAAREHGKGSGRFNAWLVQHEQELSEPVAASHTPPGAGHPGASDETALDAELPWASEQAIHEAITAEYDDAEREGRKPPNVNQIAAPVQARLRARGYFMSGRQIKELAEQPQHGKRRRKPGRTIAHEKRKQQKEILRLRF